MDEDAPWKKEEAHVPKGGRRSRHKAEGGGGEAREGGGSSNKEPTLMKKGGWGEEDVPQLHEATPDYLSADAPNVTGQNMIPTLDAEPAPKEEEPNLTMIVASVPAYRQAMPQLGDLDKGQVRFPMIKDDTDLSILTSVFTPAVDDEDIEWVPEQLFIQVMSDIQQEKDALLPPEEKEN